MSGRLPRLRYSARLNPDTNTGLSASSGHFSDFSTSNTICIENWEKFKIFEKMSLFFKLRSHFLLTLKFWVK